VVDSMNLWDLKALFCSVGDEVCFVELNCEDEAGCIRSRTDKDMYVLIYT
jgi:hypothetical protein